MLTAFIMSSSSATQKQPRQRAREISHLSDIGDQEPRAVSKQPDASKGGGDHNEEPKKAHSSTALSKPQNSPAGSGNTAATPKSRRRTQGSPQSSLLLSFQVTDDDSEALPRRRRLRPRSQDQPTFDNGPPSKSLKRTVTPGPGDRCNRCIMQRRRSQQLIVMEDGLACRRIQHLQLI